MVVDLPLLYFIDGTMHVCLTVSDVSLQVPLFLQVVMAVRRMSATAWPGFETGTHTLRKGGEMFFVLPASVE